MGGLAPHIRKTWAMMWIGSLALAGVGIPGVIGFAGFYSKDLIIESAFAAPGAAGEYAFILGISAAFLTAFYSWRLIFMTFNGMPRAPKDVMDHVHDSPPVMMVPLYVLAVGALAAGAVFVQAMTGHHWGDFWGNAIMILPTNTAMDDAHSVPMLVKFSPLIVTAIGILLAWLIYVRRPAVAQELASTFHGVYQFLLNKWYFDELYDVIFVRMAKAIGRFFWKRGDGNVIDGTLNGVAMGIIPFFTRLAGRAQSGYIFTYAFWMVIGIAVLVTWMSLSGGAQ